jgi:hypothetical protein
MDFTTFAAFALFFCLSIANPLYSGEIYRDGTKAAQCTVTRDVQARHPEKMNSRRAVDQMFR